MSKPIDALGSLRSEVNSNLKAWTDGLDHGWYDEWSNEVCLRRKWLRGFFESAGVNPNFAMRWLRAHGCVDADHGNRYTRKRIRNGERVRVVVMPLPAVDSVLNGGGARPVAMIRLKDGDVAEHIAGGTATMNALGHMHWQDGTPVQLTRANAFEPVWRQLGPT